MEKRILIRAGLKRHWGALLGIFLLITLTATVTGTVLTLWANAAHEETGLTQAGFGALTAWVSGEADTESLSTEITNLDEIGKVETQLLVFTNYTALGQESDSSFSTNRSGSATAFSLMICPVINPRPKISDLGKCTFPPRCCQRSG